MNVRARKDRGIHERGVEGLVRIGSNQRGVGNRGDVGGGGVECERGGNKQGDGQWGWGGAGDCGCRWVGAGRITRVGGGSRELLVVVGVFILCTSRGCEFGPEFIVEVLLMLLLCHLAEICSPSLECAYQIL